MKHLRIVLTLTVVVVVFSAAVFGVEIITTPIIDAENARVANLAKAEVLPTLADYDQAVESNLADYDVADTGITDLFKVSGYGFVYQAEFQGFQSKIVYMIGINEDGELTGHKTLQQADTPGLGAEIANPDNWTQFVGMSLVDAEAGNIDGLSGATITTDGWKDSIAKVISFHNNEMLGFEVTDVTADLTLPDSVTKVEVVSDGTTDLEVVYTVEFESSYSSGPNVYTITVDLTDGSIKKLAFVEATDSENIGKDIGNPEFSDQFKAMAQTDVLAGNYDVQAGASYPVTYAAFETSFEEAYMVHRVEFEDYVPVVETEEEKLARWYEELSVVDATFTDKTADYDLSATDVTKVEFANNGTEDVAVILTVEFDGFVDTVEVLVGIKLSDNTTTGLRVLEQHETSGYGAKIVEEEFLQQFDGANMLAAKYGIFDSIAGGTLTSNALRGSFENVIEFVEVQILGTGTETPVLTEAQQLQAYIAEVYPGAFGITDVSSDYTLIADVEKVLEITDLAGDSLGTLFLVNAEGASYSETTYIKFLIGIDENKQFNGFKMIDDSDTPGRADPYYLIDYSDQFKGLDIEVLDYDIDAVADSTQTHGAIMDAAESIARFYVEEILELVWARPASQTVVDATLDLAYDGVNTYTSIYDTMAYSEYITNIYEVDNGSGVVGHVIIGVADGNSGVTQINFAWGVTLAGDTKFMEIIEHAETWQDADDWGSYNGAQGYFPDTPWLAAQFESIVLAEVLTTNQIDSIANVSQTTDGMRTAAEAIAQYYADNSLGGGS